MHAETAKEDRLAEHAVATREEWPAARRELLEAEKEHFHEKDELALRRRELGRNEEGAPGRWWRRHDQYETEAA